MTTSVMPALLGCADSDEYETVSGGCSLVEEHSSAIDKSRRQWHWQ